MLTHESDLWAAGQVASRPQDQFAGRAGCARCPNGLDPLKIVVEGASVAAIDFERRVADGVGFPDLDVTGLFVNDHLDADVGDQPRCVVAPAAAHVDPMLVKARERDKAHIDALKLRTAVPFKVAAEIGQDRVFDRGVVGMGVGARYDGERDGRKEAARYPAFEANSHRDEHTPERMTAEYGNCGGSAAPPGPIS
jgi:hypothetical protein